MHASPVLRPARADAVAQALQRAPIVALLGPRQCGKTTLARGLLPATCFDLESSLDRGTLAAAPETTLGSQRGLIVLDEIQTMPELLPILRVLADRPEDPARFLLLGSASPDLMRGAAETLAGRIAFVPMGGFDIDEVGAAAMQQLWQRGGFPRSFLAADDASSYAWRQDFIETFLSRDAARFGISLPPEQLRRFWTMLAHNHGGALNASELARGIGVDQKTAAKYVDVLVGTFLVRRLPPWFTNTKKRLVKTPKVYVRDSGVLHALLGLRNESEILAHPRFGMSWEGFALEHVIQALRAERDACFWGSPSGAEVDLVVPRGGKVYGFECKFQDVPTTTRSMHVAKEELGLERLYVVYPGRRSFELAEGIRALPLVEVSTALRDL
ncbi:MAG: ATP-binding protein [Planctomycetes bacterium]|nr:ATP-binding protein [Planctomycetota bacterium]